MANPRQPWIYVGGSYSGMLAAWLQRFEPGVFWAYHSSSAPVQAVYHFWSYFSPIERGMPRNCSADGLLISDHITEVYERGNATEMHKLKDLFGLAGVEHYDDFAWYLVSPLAPRYAFCFRTGG